MVMTPLALCLPSNRHKYSFHVTKCGKHYCRVSGTCSLDWRCCCKNVCVIGAVVGTALTSVVGAAVAGTALCWCCCCAAELVVDDATHQWRWNGQALSWHSLLQYLVRLHRRHLANWRGDSSHRPHSKFAHWRTPPLDSSLRQEFLMIAPAQYFISSENCRVVNRSTSKKMFLEAPLNSSSIS